MLVLLSFLLLPMACNNGPGNRSTGSGIIPEWAEQKDEIETDKKVKEVDDRIAVMQKRIPGKIRVREYHGDLPRTNYTAITPKPAVRDDTPSATKSETSTEKQAPMISDSATIDDVIAGLEGKKTLTDEERFQLTVLKGLQGSRNDKELLGSLHGGRGNAKSPEWYMIYDALESAAGGNADEALVRLRAAETQLRERSSVKVEPLVFCQTVSGMSIYIPRKSDVFLRGEEALVYVEVSDFQCSKKGDRYEYSLDCDAVLLDTAGRVTEKLALNKALKSNVFSVRSRIDRQFYPLKFVVPRGTYRGEHILRITITDKLKEQFAEQQIRMVIR